MFDTFNGWTLLVFYVLGAAWAALCWYEGRS
jgi:hypothetical protein